MDDGHVKSAPFIDTHAEANCLGGDSKHGRVVRDEDNTTRWRDSCLKHADDVRN